MSASETPNLALPYLAAAQAQKHVTHNEALLRLDALVQLAVASRRHRTPPAAASDGARYVVPAGATDAWAEAVDAVAVREDGAWTFYRPATGWCAWVADERRLLVFDGTAWRATAFDPADGLDGLARLGINATASAMNRLAVSSPATLLDHDGSGHQLKINKAEARATASLLFQTGYEGRVEIGTAGDDQLRVKVASAAGTWTDALVVATGGHLLPGQDNTQSLGAPGRRWTTVFATNGVATASDARDKEVIASLAERASAIVDAVEPVVFRRSTEPGGPAHAGFLAQDVQRALTGTGTMLAAWGLDDPADPASRQWVRSDELMAVLWQAVRETRERLTALEARRDR